MMKSTNRTTGDAALSKSPPMSVVPRIVLTVVAITAICTGVLAARMSALRAAPATQRDLNGMAVLTPANSATIVEAMRIDAKGVTEALFLPDGKSLALAMPDGVVLYDVATGTPQRTIATGASRRIAISANGEIVATVAGNEAKLWRMSDGALLQTLSGHSNTIEDIAFSPDGTMVATAALDRSVRLWNVSNGQLLFQLRHLGHVYSLTFRFDGLLLATGSDAGTTLWNPDNGARVRIADVAFDIVNQLVFSPDGLTLALAMNWGIVKFRNDTNYVNSYETPRGQAVHALAFSPNGQLLAYGGSDQRVQVMDVASNVPLISLTGYQGAINSVAFSSDGRLLAATATDGTLRIWGSEERSLSTPSPTATATPVARVTVVVHAPTSPLATPTAKTPATSASGVQAVGRRQPVQEGQSPTLPLVVIEPEEVKLTSTDWQRVGHISGPGANVTLCQDNRLWLSSNQRVWSFDGQAWQEELAGKAATVACDPDGVPYALVTSPSLEENRIVSTLYRREDGEWKEAGIASFYAGVGQMWFDWAVDRDGSIWVPTLLDGGTEGGVINGVVHYADGVWNLYVGENEERLDDPNSMLGALVSGMKIHKVIPAELEGPATLSPDALSNPLSFYPDLDISEDGRIWLSRPGTWPLVFDGRRWRPGVDRNLSMQLTATLKVDTSGIGLQEALQRHPELIGAGVLSGHDAPWVAVAGGVLHREEEQWMFYSLPIPSNYPGTIIPLAEGRDGVVWLWNVTGLLRFDGTHWQRFTGDSDFNFLFDPFNSWPAATLDATVGADGALWMGGLRLLPSGPPITSPTELGPGD